MEQTLAGFPKELAQVVADGIKHGVSEEQIVRGMVSLGNFAEKVISPDNAEEALIKALWDEATREEKETLARIVLRVAKKKLH